MDISHHLAWYGLRRSLVQAAADQKFVDFMSFITKWHKDLCWVLERDPEHHLGWRYYELVHVIEEECTKFPNPAILAAYLSPLMSWSSGRHPPVSIVMLHQPDLTALAVFCCPTGSPDKYKKKGRALPAAKEQPTLHAAHQIKEAGKQTHLQAARTRATYGRHIHQGCVWLQSHFPVEGSQPPPNHTEEILDIYSDPCFKDAFDHTPNQCSDEALALYLSWRGFQENCSQTFKMWWDEACIDGATFCGDWHHNDAWHQWEGNPVNSDGAEQTHSGAMKKKYMDQILTWSESLCLLNVPFQYIQLVMAGLESLPPEALNKVTKSVITQHIEQLTFSAAAFTLWTRNFELVKLKHGDVQFDNIAIDGMFLKYLQGEEQSLTINEHGTYFEVHLKNQKGWQRKLDKGMRETDLWSNCYKIYPCPNMGTAYFLFPAVETNGVLQPGEPLSHDTVQKWIGEATVGAGIWGTFSTHCFHCGGAQYWFMFAPIDGEHHDTLMWYLLDELHCYKSDHSDALGPISQEANVSLTGEGTLTQPASTEALHMAHTSLTADVAALHKTVNKVCASQEAMAGDVRDIHEMFDNMSNQVQMASTSASSHNTIQTPPTVQSIPATQSQLSTFYLQPTPITLPLIQHSQPSHSPTVTTLHLAPAAVPNTIFLAPFPSSIGPHRPVQSSIPPKGLVILCMPVICKDDMQTPRSESWKDIVHHWREGEGQLGLTILLKDWLHSWYNRPHGQKFNSKYYQQKLIVMEYLNNAKVSMPAQGL
ncbi:hypothetical protein V8B97DRAFT_2027566 [Scleroderma yunnanense]